MIAQYLFGDTKLGPTLETIKSMTPNQKSSEAQLKCMFSQILERIEQFYKLGIVQGDISLKYKNEKAIKARCFT